MNKTNNSRLIGKLNRLHALCESASEKLKSEYEKADVIKNSSVEPFKKEFDKASAKLAVALKNIPDASLVKFNSFEGKYMPAFDPRTGKENFSILIRTECTSCVTVQASSVDDAYRQVEEFIDNNKVDIDEDPVITLEEVSTNV